VVGSDSTQKSLTIFLAAIIVSTAVIAVLVSNRLIPGTALKTTTGILFSICVGIRSATRLAGLWTACGERW
jgi:hypothetical protein